MDGEKDTNHRKQTVPSGAVSQDIGADELKQLAGNLQSANGTFQLQLANTLLLQNMQESQRQQQAQFEQRLRQQEEEHQQRMRLLEESSGIKHKDSLQGTRHVDLATDRQWNVDEGIYAAGNIIREQSRREDTK